jgi:hypothetical protein
VSAIEHAAAGEEYAVGGENVPQIRAFELLREMKGTPLPRRIPYAVAWFLGWLEEQTARGRPPRLTRGTVRILGFDWPLDSTRSVGELSYRVTPLPTGLRTMVDGIF